MLLNLKSMNFIFEINLACLMLRYNLIKELGVMKQTHARVKCP